MMKNNARAFLLMLTTTLSCVAFQQTYYHKNTIQSNRFVSLSSVSKLHTMRTTPHNSFYMLNMKETSDRDLSNETTSLSLVNSAQSLTLACILSFTMMFFSPSNNNVNSMVANAMSNYDDDSSETVSRIINSLKSTSGKPSESMEIYRELNELISEGKGVGGSVSYEGKLGMERGMVADEDTFIYNPGLSLLTETEKQSLVQALVTNKQASNSDELNVAFQALKGNLDPFHTYELGGYLSFLPFYAAAIYLGVLFIQQNLRPLFPVAYFVGALAVFGPILILAGSGP